MKSMNNSKVAILSSCAGYGTYVPSLLLSNELSSKGILNKVFVYESFFNDSEKKKFLEYRKNFHKSFRFAKMASDVSATIEDNSDVEEIYKSFKMCNCDFYVVMFGSWLNVIEKIGISSKKVLCLRLDVSDTPSWSRVGYKGHCFNTEWLLGKAGCMPNYLLCRDTYNKNVFPRVVLHGGGWGINHFLPVAEKLKNKYEIYTIHSTKEEAEQFKTLFNEKSFYMPIDWLPDEKTAFPPLIDSENGEFVSYRDMARNCCAVVSKPGGGTCLDALLIKVPPIFLQSMAKHESNNSLHMVKNHLANYFEIWEDENFSYEFLLQIREKLIIKTENMSYITDYIERIVQSGTV